MPSTSKAKEEDEDDMDTSEFDRIDKMLEKDESNSLKFLDFEKQTFLDCVYNDGLVICAK
jgi:hypothetical protein